MLEGNQIEWEKLQNDASKFWKRINPSYNIFILYIFFIIVNAERNKNASLTNTCEQLREQLDQAHSKVWMCNRINFSNILSFIFIILCVQIASLEGQCADHTKCIEQLKEQIQDKGLQCDQLSKEKGAIF